jgi:hypothetical protein
LADAFTEPASKPASPRAVAQLTWINVNAPQRGCNRWVGDPIGGKYDRISRKPAAAAIIS